MVQYARIFRFNRLRPKSTKINHNLTKFHSKIEPKISFKNFIGGFPVMEEAFGELSNKEVYQIQKMHQ